MPESDDPSVILPAQEPNDRGSPRRDWEDHYLECELLDQGGLGRVLRVQDRNSGEYLALKEPLLDDADTLRRFSREIEIQNRLEHENIMPIRGYGDRWFVMPLAETSLRAQAASLFEPEVVQIFDSVAAGLGATHAKDIVHRDVKPGNILLLSEGGRSRWVIGDFGLVRRPRGQSTGPATGHPLGTPDFMAPEVQAGAHIVGPTADVYSLGKTLLWVLTGRVSGDAPRFWEGLVNEMTAIHVDDRIQNMTTVRHRLAKVLEEIRIRQRGSWGRAIEELSDIEVKVLQAVLENLRPDEGSDDQVALFENIDQTCQGLNRAAIHLQLDKLEHAGLVRHMYESIWAITPKGMAWLRANEQRLTLTTSRPTVQRRWRAFERGKNQTRSVHLPRHF